MMLDDIKNFVLESFSEETLEKLIVFAEYLKQENPIVRKEIDESIVELQKELDKRKKTE